MHNLATIVELRCGYVRLGRLDEAVIVLNPQVV